MNSMSSKRKENLHKAMGRFQALIHGRKNSEKNERSNDEMQFIFQQCAADIIYKSSCTSEWYSLKLNQKYGLEVLELF